MSDPRLDMPQLRIGDEPAGAAEAGPPPAWHELLGRWLAGAIDSGLVGQGNAMQVATLGADGHPAVRSVLCKGIDERGAVFYTNLESDKARQLGAHPHAEAVLAWVPLERQVRIRGPVEPVGREQTLEYWATRPRGSQLGAWASPQSRPLPSRAWLDQRFDEAEARFAGGQVPLPPHWGGFRIVADRVEFWAGGPDRRHERLLWRRSGEDWAIERLAP
ncbi:MAG: pyridoxamine 5'-phosphate oxidase [Frankiaceae bacterium]|nr:pyridoxamine 5'-phosphate oxidase [Frankiaceae bacterium]